MPRGVVLWTRLARSVLDGAGAILDPVVVDWEIAEDEAFGRTVQTGSAVALPELGHSVHVEVDGLEPGRDYFYRMITGGEASFVGRTKTPRPDVSAIDLHPLRGARSSPARDACLRLCCASPCLRAT